MVHDPQASLSPLVACIEIDFRDSVGKSSLCSNGTMAIFTHLKFGSARFGSGASDQSEAFIRYFLLRSGFEYQIVFQIPVYLFVNHFINPWPDHLILKPPKWYDVMLAMGGIDIVYI